MILLKFHNDLHKISVNIFQCARRLQCELHARILSHSLWNVNIICVRQKWSLKILEVMRTSSQHLLTYISMHQSAMAEWENVEIHEKIHIRCCARLDSRWLDWFDSIYHSDGLLVWSDGFNAPSGTVTHLSARRHLLSVLMFPNRSLEKISERYVYLIWWNESWRVKISRRCVVRFWEVKKKIGRLKRNISLFFFHRVFFHRGSMLTIKFSLIFMVTPNT